MTTTAQAESLTLPLDPGSIAGKTRAELLELCRAAGLRATAWKRERMAAALTGAEPPPEAKGNVLAAQLEARREERTDDLVKRARENREKRTGRCVSTVCRLQCPAYEFGHRDAFGWELCTCGHTQWAHAEPEPAAE